MAQDFSFDISAGFDKQELVNAMDQLRREVASRFDFKGVYAESELSDDKKSLYFKSISEVKILSLIDILESKLIKRNIPLSILKKDEKVEPTGGSLYKKTIYLVDSLDTDQAKSLSKKIRESFPKVKTTIQGESVRVFSKSKNDLQEVIKHLREDESDLPLIIDNYR